MHKSVVSVYIRLIDVNIGSLSEEDFDAIVEAVALVVAAKQQEGSHSCVSGAVDVHRLFVRRQFVEPA